jgi:hypothetical protein
LRDQRTLLKTALVKFLMEHFDRVHNSRH